MNHPYPQKIEISDYQYELPEESIAKYPLARRDGSKLLVRQHGTIRESTFDQLPSFLSDRSLMIFNNTRVIRARLLFQKATGATIEIFCLEPARPNDYSLIFQQRHQCSWHCLVGNSKRWKEGLLERRVTIGNETILLTAERTEATPTHQTITFQWDHPEYTFADLLEAIGILPIPPYLNRKTEEEDLDRYQTLYAKIKGSVAAPTAGLHFTPELLTSLEKRGIKREEVTLHVGAGTFKPVTSDTIGEHEMHTEHIVVRRETINRLIEHLGSIIAVGTTSVRTLESLYHLGVMLITDPEAADNALTVTQWAPYEVDTTHITPHEALQQLLHYLDANNSDQLIASTKIIIAPGYTFQVVRGIITNFHLPQSTLLLLVSAFVDGEWRAIYDYALEHDFRFLSYGDSSLLL